MAHHYSGPDFSFPHGDARVGHTDLFAFPAPQHTARSVLVIDVHPPSESIRRVRRRKEPFAPEAIYELKIDTNGDAVADVAFRTRFSAANGAQSATVLRVEGANAAGIGESGDVVVSDAPVSTGHDAQVTAAATTGCQSATPPEAPSASFGSSNTILHTSLSTSTRLPNTASGTTLEHGKQTATTRQSTLTEARCSSLSRALVVGDL